VLGSFVYVFLILAVKVSSSTINCHSLKLFGVCGVMYIAAHTYSEL